MLTARYGLDSLIMSFLLKGLRSRFISSPNMKYTKNRYSIWFKSVPPTVRWTVLFNDTCLSEEFYVLLNGRMAMNDELQRMRKKAVVVNGKVLFWRCVCRASYCNVLITNEMQNSYNQFLFHSSLSRLYRLYQTV